MIGSLQPGGFPLCPQRARRHSLVGLKLRNGQIVMDDGQRGSVSCRVGEGRNEGSGEEGSLMNGGLFQANYSISCSDKEPFPFSHWVFSFASVFAFIERGLDTICEDR